MMTAIKTPEAAPVVVPRTRFRARLDASDLRRALVGADKAATGSTSLPILAFVRLDVADGGLRLAATDLCAEAVCTLRCAEAFGDAVCVNARHLLTLVETIPDGPVELVESRTDYWGPGLEVRFRTPLGGAVYTFLTGKVDTFPGLLALDEGARPLATMIAGDLAALLRPACAAANVNTGKWYDAVRLTFTATHAMALGTDGSRMAQTCFRFRVAAAAAAGTEIFCRATSYAAVLARCKAGPLDEVTLSATAKALLLAFATDGGDVVETLSVKREDENWPDDKVAALDTFVGEAFRARRIAIVDAPTFRKLLRDLAKGAARGRNAASGVWLRWANGVLYVERTGSEGEAARRQVPARDVNGAGKWFAAGPLLIDALGDVPEGDVELRAKTDFNYNFDPIALATPDGHLLACVMGRNDGDKNPAPVTE